MKIQIRRGIFETSSSSASTMAVAANGAQKRKVTLTEPFRFVPGVYNTNGDGIPHCYITDWRSKMSYFAKDTEDWHAMFRNYTGQDFTVHTLWVISDTDDIYMASPGSLRDRGELENYRVKTGSTYCSFDGYICGTAREVNGYRDGDLFALPDGMDGEAYGLVKFHAEYHPRLPFEKMMEFLEAPNDSLCDQRLMEEIIFNDAIGVNIGSLQDPTFRSALPPKTATSSSSSPTTAPR